MCYCHDLDPFHRETIDDHERITLHQVATRPEQVICPTLGRLLNSMPCILEFFLKRICCLLAAYSVPFVRLKCINASIRRNSSGNLAMLAVAHFAHHVVPRDELGLAVVN